MYEIVNSPSHGHLVFAENITLPIKRFTQADVNRKRVIYFHSSGSGGQRGRGGGGGRLKPDDFYFKVSDGQHDPVYRHFRIHIIPLELNLANLTAIQIQQVSKFWSQCCVQNVGVVYTTIDEYNLRFAILHRALGWLTYRRRTSGVEPTASAVSPTST